MVVWQTFAERVFLDVINAEGRFYLGDFADQAASLGLVPRLFAVIVVDPHGDKTGRMTHFIFHADCSKGRANLFAGNAHNPLQQGIESDILNKLEAGAV